MTDLTIVGGGLAGCEAAWQAAERGVHVKLYEMRPFRKTGAHSSDNLAELVCSNSLGSNLPNKSSGLLKAEMRKMGSMLIECADRCAVPAGSALAVDREEFAAEVTSMIENHPNIEVIRTEMKEIPEGFSIIATGPLSSASISTSIVELLGTDNLYFYDALSPIVYYDSIDMDVAFKASRYEDGEDGDYINCPMNYDQYVDFVKALLDSDRIPLREFEEDIKSGVRAGSHKFFEGCLPVEIIAERGIDSLAYGPMRPVGIRCPNGGKRPYAIVQLRRDNLAGSLYNIVGFQTNLVWPDQKRVLKMIPGLGNARFARYGMMHRNTFINSPKAINVTLQSKIKSDLFFAGQITGVEGYAGNIATGLVAGINVVRLMNNCIPLNLSLNSMIGSLCHYVANADSETFQPMKANFGLLPSLSPPSHKRKWSKRERYELYSRRALESLDSLEL
ncbi:MAG TPA: methylenetetrahydrofolate--tRNA-(uracil(54)-C(5))-methyltransferase (FADH(2)-oxidizing) TrmFO [Chloroflexi bacterium]|nr:methylenetetrahydrofolate--tRNA-(uracil(54)-C(5))-methyltransferase (FADH(2)-oxidizing) TrmFO [Chloroflexota bacterium]HCU98538.1 methylenetetrahydrofolate--tRNA-(uracil(54)-C(5))-methyltransferase (FADH(2)-oxidizing) TrmFO [Chloroflexota bacterium]